MPVPEISPLDSAILGVVEGLTEFLPVSSTGHLILTSAWLGLDLDDTGLNAFLIVIQAGALLAILGLYRESVVAMIKGLLGRSREGRNILMAVVIAFIPAAVVGLLFEDVIENMLFYPAPVALALALGGIAMIGIEPIKRRWFKQEAGREEFQLHEVTWRMALMIGFAQCFALWPGTSRSMVTILGAMLVGLPPRAAAEFSFLLALPTLGGATVYKLLKDGDHVLESAGYGGLAIGFIVSCIVAALAVKFFLHFIVRYGLAAFGYYRIALAALVLLLWSA